MKGWARKHEYELLREYFDEKFFDDFLYVVNNHTSEYAEMFFKYLNPSLNVTQYVSYYFIIFLDH